MTNYIMKTDKEIIADILLLYDVLNEIDTIEAKEHDSYSELFMMFDIRLDVFSFYTSDSIEDTCEHCLETEYRNSFLIHFVSYLVTAFYQYHNYYESMQALEDMKDYYVHNLVHLLDDDGM